MALTSLCWKETGAVQTAKQGFFDIYGKMNGQLLAFIMGQPHETKAFDCFGEHRTGNCGASTDNGATPLFLFTKAQNHDIINKPIGF